MNAHSTEDLLRRTLTDKVGEVTCDFTLDDIRRDAAARRHHSRWRTAGAVAAAAVVLVGIPTALYVHATGDDPDPTPLPSPTSSQSLPPSPSPTRTTSTVTGLDAISRGPDPAVAWVRDGVVHEPDGSTSQLPAGATDVTQFTPYHGGWIVLDSVGGLVQYDSSGTVVRRSHTGESALAVSFDQMRTAFQVDGHIRVGITTGMGEGESDLAAADGGRLVGLLGDDRVVYGSRAGIVVSDLTGHLQTLDGLSSADATSGSNDLVGGIGKDGTSGAVVSVRTRSVLWVEPWQPRAFSPDGRYVVAVLAPESEATDIAILDAQSGSVVARASLADLGVSQFGVPVWEDSDQAVLVGVQDASGQAVLRLARDGTVSRATDVEPVSEMPAWIFATTP